MVVAFDSSYRTSLQVAQLRHFSEVQQLAAMVLALSLFSPLGSPSSGFVYRVLPILASSNLFCLNLLLLEVGNLRLLEEEKDTLHRMVVIEMKEST